MAFAFGFLILFCITGVLYYCLSKFIQYVTRDPVQRSGNDAMCDEGDAFVYTDDN